MDPVGLALLIIGNLILLGIFIYFYQRFKSSVIKSSEEILSRDRQLKRQILELQVLRSLNERVGYSLDLGQILEVIIDSLSELLSFTAVSYMLVEPQGKISFKARVQETVSRPFLDQVKSQMLGALSAMRTENLQMSLVNETISGLSLDEQSPSLVSSFFNLPLVIGDQVAAVINISSSEKGLYGDEETAILYTILNQVSASASKLSQVLENNKRRLYAMIAALKDGVMMVDLNLNLLVANPNVYIFLDQAPTSSVFDIFASLLPKIDLQSALKEALSLQQPVRLPEFLIRRRNILLEVEIVKDKFGYLLGAVVIFHDTTAEKQLEKMRQDFTAVMVHELRTPLTTIIYGVDMLSSDLKKLSQSEILANLAVVKSTSDNMLSLVNELLDIAKIEAGKFEIIKRPNDLKALIDEELKVFTPFAKRKNLLLKTVLDPQISTVSFDRSRLSQVLENLLSNSIKYTDSGDITISTALGDEGVIVSVADTGEGIEQQDIPKLFSKFEQLKKDIDRETTGTGLGLVVAKGIIEAHGGKIWAASKGLGKGATFSFSLPVGES